MCIKRLNASGVPRGALSRLAGIALLASLAASAAAQVAQPPVVVNGRLVRPVVGGRATLPGGKVQLPFVAADNTGTQWYVYGDGALRQQMGQPVFAQGALLTYDGATFNTMNNQGSIDPKTGELVLEGGANNAPPNGINVTRRINFDKDNQYVRYIDVFHNAGTQDRTINVALQTSLNWGIQQSQLIPDPKHSGVNLAWCGMTGLGRAVLEIYGGGGKVNPDLNNQNGSNVIMAAYSLTVPAGKTAALVHLHLFSQSVEAGVKFVGDLSASKMLKNVPSDLRREIANFSASAGILADMDILRGDVFDVVELRSGDQYKGTLQESTYKLDTFYGLVELPAEKVVALASAGPYRPRQLIIAADGEIFGGRLSKPTIDIALTSGQMVSIPLNQISRVGYRKRNNEPEEITLDKPMVFLRGGDRVAVNLPAAKISAATHFGLLQLDPAAVASISFQSDETNVQDIYLTDGSRFSGLLATDTLDMQLNGVGPTQTVKFPVAGLARLQFVPKPPDSDPDAPSLTLINQDTLCGSLAGEIKLETTFDTLTLDGRQIRHITRPDTTADAPASVGIGGPSPQGIQISLWDGSTMSGEVVADSVQCHLISGAVLALAPSMIKEYDNPHPLPSADMVKQIQAAAADLAADDWRQRDRAEATLGTMGPAIIGVLRDIRPKMDPEAQQRIEGIIKKLQAAPAPGANAGPGGPRGIMMPQ